MLSLWFSVNYNNLSRLINKGKGIYYFMLHSHATWSEEHFRGNKNLLFHAKSSNAVYGGYENSDSFEGNRPFAS